MKDLFKFYLIIRIMLRNFSPMKISFLALFFRATGLFLFWILLSGKIDAIHLFFGGLSALLIAAYSAQLAKSILPPVSLLQMPVVFFRYVRYCIWLTGRILLAAVHVSRLVLSPRLPIHPRLYSHATPLKTDLERVLFANSITLTPGTITVDLKDGTLMIHQLDEDSSGDIHSGEMEKQIARIFGRGEKS